MDGGAAFGVVPQTIWGKLIQPDENNLIPITTRCLLVQEDDGRNILFDTGMGRKQSEKYYGYRFIEGDHDLIASLKKQGLTPEDITDVVFTHLHDDHCGGATYRDRDGAIRLTFPKATHHVSEAQWLWAIHPNSREAGSFFPVNLKPLEESGQLNLIKEPGNFSEHITLHRFDGHTRGQLIPEIRINGKTLFFTADFIPSPAHIPIPFVASVDIEPLIALKEKEQFLDEACEKGWILLFQHDRDTEACTLVRTEKGVRAGENLRLTEILD